MAIPQGSELIFPLKQVFQWAAGAGWLAPLVFIVLQILACLLFLPGNLVAIGAGAVFGLWWGFVLVSAANLIGAGLAFQLGRTVAREWVEKKVGADPRFVAMDAAVAHEGFKIVALCRLTPIFPFSVLNYAFGLTRVSLKDYILATAVAMLPSNLMHAYLGSLAASAGQRQGWADWAGSVLILGVGLVALYFIARFTRRALHEAGEAAAKR